MSELETALIIHKIATIERGLMNQIIDLELTLIPTLTGKNRDILQTLVEKARLSLQASDAELKDTNTANPDLERLKLADQLKYPTDCELCGEERSLADMDICATCGRAMCEKCTNPKNRELCSECYQSIFGEAVDNGDKEEQSKR
jgi:hypothetical protein